METKQVKIMRGISGAGKSTYAQVLAASARAQNQLPLICSADDFFIGPEGYKFDIAKLGEAHNWCLRKFLKGLQDLKNPIIIDNTNIRLEDISPYVAVGAAFGYEVEILQINTPPEVAATRNVHGVTQNHVNSMYKNLMATKLPYRFKVVNIDIIYE